MTVALISVESACIPYISAHLSRSWSSANVEKASVAGVSEILLSCQSRVSSACFLDESCWDVFSHQFSGERPELCPKLFSR